MSLSRMLLQRSVLVFAATARYGHVNVPPSQPFDLLPPLKKSHATPSDRKMFKAPWIVVATNHRDFDQSAATTHKNKLKVRMNWEQKFAVLRLFKQIHGHCRVPPWYQIGGFKLGGWVVTQKKEFVKHRSGLGSEIINDKRVARLDRNGFEWGLWAPSSVLPFWNGMAHGGNHLALS